MRAIVAEFEDGDRLMKALSRLRDAGYRQLEAYTPFPMEELEQVIPRPMRLLPVLVFLGGLFGLALGLWLQWYGAAVNYPINIGGRPPDSWPAYAPIAYEGMVGAAVFTGFFGFFALAGLPRPYQEISEVPGFERATQDRFFLSVDEQDPKFDADAVRALLREFEPCRVSQLCA